MQFALSAFALLSCAQLLAHAVQPAAGSEAALRLLVMFVVARLKDTIKVLPRDLGKPAADILAIAINSKYGNKARRRSRTPTRAEPCRLSPA